MPSGIKCKLYRNTGTYGAPVWDEIKIVGDVDLEVTPTLASASTRETLVERSLVVGFKLGVTGSVRVVTTNADYVALEAAAISGATVDVLALNGDRLNPGATGVRFPAKISPWGEKQPVGGIVMRDFGLTPSLEESDTDLPKYAITSGTAGSAAITYSEFGSAV